LTKGKAIQETCEYLTLDTSDKMTLTDLDNPKTLLKLISLRACELAHKVGAKLVADFSKWDEYQHYDIYSMTKAYYENFSNQTF